MKFGKMYKKFKLILVLIITSILVYKIFFSANSKENFSWIFEGQEEKQVLPELSNEEIEKNSKID